MGHTWQLRRWKGSRHRVALSAAARDYESSLLLPARGRCTRSRVELGRGERDRLGMPSDGLSYKCSAETCPGRLQTCFCNAEPRILASQGTHLSLSFFLSVSISLPPFLFLLSTSSRRRGARCCPCTIEGFRFYGATIVGVILVKIRYAHYAASRWILRHTRNAKNKLSAIEKPRRPQITI